MGSVSASLPPVPLEPLAGDDPDRIGAFRLLGRLGAGGMGVAYLAAGPTQDWVVVKTVWKHLAADRSYRARLSRELDAMGRASGSHTASLLDSDVQADPPWFAMEFIPGMTLTRRVDDSGALPMSEVVALAAALVDVLVSVHGAGIVHRDLKPSNIMLSPSGPKLIDFGIADMSEGTQLTKTGMVLGSTGWLAPEQVRSDPVTAATDIHAWALCVLYAATGQPPFGADNSTATIYKVLESSPTVPNTVPEPLHNLLVAALTKEPNHRPTLERLQIELIPGTPPVIVPPRAPRTVTPSVIPAAVTPSSPLTPTPIPPSASPSPPAVARPATPTNEELVPMRAASTSGQLRQQSVAEAFRRDPTLLADTEPETLARLAIAVASIQEELQLVEDIRLARQAKVEAEVAERRRDDQIAGIFRVGDNGPGGGIVFFDAGSTQVWGRFLEAAPAGWNGTAEDPRLPWHERRRPKSIMRVEGNAIGTGAENTASILAATSFGAAHVASGYTGGGKTDWFLPSRGELNALYKERVIVGGLALDRYWSSSQFSAFGAWLQGMGNGFQDTGTKLGACRVRPVRAFNTNL